MSSNIVKYFTLVDIKEIFDFQYPFVNVVIERKGLDLVFLRKETFALTVFQNIPVFCSSIASQQKNRFFLLLFLIFPDLFKTNAICCSTDLAASNPYFCHRLPFLSLEYRYLLKYCRQQIIIEDIIQVLT